MEPVEAQLHPLVGRRLERQAALLQVAVAAVAERTRLEPAAVLRAGLAERLVAAAGERRCQEKSVVLLKLVDLVSRHGNCIRLSADGR